MKRLFLAFLVGVFALSLAQPEAPEVMSVPWTVGGVAQPALLQLSYLRRLLEPKGVKLTEMLMLNRNVLEMSFPGTANSLYVRVVEQNSTPYVVFDDILINLAQLDLGLNVPVRVEGWATPTLTIGATSFKLGSKNGPVNPYLAYMYLVRKTLLDRGDAPPYLSKLLDDNPKTRACTHQLASSDPAGTVYAVASRRWADINLKAPYDRIPGGFPQPSAFDLAPVENGRVRLKLPEASAQYAPSLEAWQKSRDPDTLILIKLSGKIVDNNAEYQVVVPSSGKTQAVSCKGG